MAFNVFLAEPDQEHWIAMIAGVRRQRPEASALRVKDGEQALRFLFERGLMTDQPQTPDLIVLAAELERVPTSIVLTRIRQHPRTHATPVIVVQHDARPGEPAALKDGQQWLHRQPRVVVILGAPELDKAISAAIVELFDDQPPVSGDQAFEITTGDAS